MQPYYKQPVVNQPADCKLPGLDLTVTEARAAGAELRALALKAVRGSFRAHSRGALETAAQLAKRSAEYDENAAIYERQVASFLGA